MAWADERIIRMDAALNRIEAVAQELQEIDAIANALIEAAIMPSSSTALRTIVRALAFRLGDMSAKAEDIIEIVNTGLTLTEAEKECAE